MRSRSAKIHLIDVIYDPPISRFCALSLEMFLDFLVKCFFFPHYLFTGKLRLVTYTDAATRTTSLRISSDVSPLALDRVLHVTSRNKKK